MRKISVRFISLPLAIFLAFSSMAILQGQEGQISDIINSIAEEMAENESESEEAGIIAERLYDLAENPVKLNQADENELSRLFFLSDFQIRSLADYIHSSGKIVSMFEIANIPGFDREVAEMMSPFTTLESGQVSNGDSSRIRNTLLINATVRSNNRSSTASGSPWKMLSKYKFTAGGFTGGITAEKDPGEKFLSGNPPLPDFFSGHLAWTGKGILRKIMVGDFNARFGQGTNINTGIRTGISLTSSGYLQGGDEIKPYTSADENNFFRGTAFQLQLKKTSVTFFWSINRIDASMSMSADSSLSQIVSFYKTGIHDSPSSLIKKDAVTETASAIAISHDFRNIRTGALWSCNRFTAAILNTGNDPQEIFEFEGSGNQMATVYYKSLFRRMILFGEFSYGSDRKKSIVQGLSFRPDDRLNINLLYRSYDPGFSSFHGKGPFSSSSGDNLNGIFGNFTFEAAKHLFISAGCDLRRYPWLRYRCSAPSTASSSELRIKYLPTGKLSLELLYSYRVSMQDRQEEISGIKLQEEINSRSLRALIKYSLSETISLTNRLEYRKAEPGGSTGMLLLQDIKLSFRSVPVTVWIRYCIFNTDDWNSRIYTYENDLLRSFSIPALAGEGSRSYIMTAWKISKDADIRVKYGLTSLKSSNDYFTETNELKVQLRLWF